jgi:uncharacterized membrane protein
LKNKDPETVKPTNWFGIILAFTALTVLCVYLIPSDSVFSPVRVFFGFTFVAFIPGYCLVSFLFPEGKLDFPENVVLSVALSFAIAGISGLFLGLSPIGISISSITQVLSGVVIVLAVLAFLRRSGLFKLHLRKLGADTSTQPVL